MIPERITLEKAVELHRKLWNWLAENPTKRKYEWPGMADASWEYDFIPNSCFMCKFVYDQTEEARCEECPLDWTNDGEYPTQDCENGDIFCAENEYGLYDIYKESWRLSRRTLESDPHAEEYYAETAKIARTIANLPLKEKYQEQLRRETIKSNSVE